ncbi:cytochrome-c oxidase, cbb3-type subunit III [Aurantivibrio infirmus]
MSLFWNIWIIGLTVISTALVMWVLLANRKVAVRDDQDPEDKTTGHVYDGIEEYDNPLPRWWFQLFILTFVFAVVYLILFPGLGSWPGVLNWTSEKRLDNEFAVADQRYGELYAGFAAQSIEQLADDPQAEKIGVRLFSNHCSTCHGADGGGNFGFPNLTDGEWLYGGTPEAIKTSITHGRIGQMPAWGSVVGEESVLALTEYVLKISGQDHTASKAQQGEAAYQQFCAACHMADGKGNFALGAPNLTDNDAWLYGGSREIIAQTIRSGRSGAMPAQSESLREEKIHLLTAYVYGLARDYAELEDK